MFRLPANGLRVLVRLVDCKSGGVRTSQAVQRIQLPDRRFRRLEVFRRILPAVLAAVISVQFGRTGAVHTPDTDRRVFTSTPQRCPEIRRFIELHNFFDTVLRHLRVAPSASWCHRRLRSNACLLKCTVGHAASWRLVRRVAGHTPLEPDGIR